MDETNNTNPVSVPNYSEPVTTEPVVTPAPITTPEPIKIEEVKPESVADKLAEAKKALAGPERAAKIEQAEHIREAKAESEQIEQRLAVLAKEKEKLELLWIKLDDEKTVVKQKMAPITSEESKVEAEEAALEKTESETGLPDEKHKVEESRRVVEDKRRVLEDQKWQLQAEIDVIDGKIAEQTASYQKLLDEEEALQAKLDALKAQIKI